MSVISIQGISKNFGENQALNQVSFEIPEGKIFGLLGPNGAGKSTLIRIITQIIEKDEGEILFRGEKLVPSHISKFGYLPEERGLYKKMKVGEQLVYLARLKGLSKAEATSRSKEWVKKMELTDWWGNKVIDLSKGMQQKIQFIATIIHNPEVLILDEPFSGFDPLNAGLVRDLILDLKEKGVNILLSTHRMESVEELCDRIVLIHKSEKVLEGDKAELKERFKQNKFLVKIKGEAPKLKNGCESKLISRDNEIFEYQISPNKKVESGNFLKELTSELDLLSFQEDLPSMEQIFRLAVKKETDE
jgi:ABC-2 type transport system ATP-binding protein